MQSSWMACLISSSVSQTTGIHVLVSSNRLMYFSVVLRVLSLCPKISFTCRTLFVSLYSFEPLKRLKSYSCICLSSGMSYSSAILFR